MARHFFTALALAHGAAALLDQYVDVVVNVDVLAPAVTGLPKLKAVAQGLSGEDDQEGWTGYKGCIIVDAVISSCYYNQQATAFREDVGCFCCDDKTALGPSYSACATYFRDSGDPEYQSAATSVSSMAEICSQEGGAGMCATRTAAPTTRSATRSRVTDVPAPCTSVVNIYNRCDSTAKDEEGFLDCLCHDTSGKVNTDIEDYASSCLPFIKTAVPTDYSIFSQLQEICDPTSSSSKSQLLFSIVSTRTDMSQSEPTEETTSAPTSSPTDGADAAAETTSTSSGLAAPGAALPGALAWIVNLATFFLSFFILI